MISTRGTTLKGVGLQDTFTPLPTEDSQTKHPAKAHRQLDFYREAIEVMKNSNNINSDKRNRTIWHIKTGHL